MRLRNIISKNFIEIYDDMNSTFLKMPVNAYKQKIIAVTLIIIE